jgi:uncharacterized membrane protein YeiB
MKQRILGFDLARAYAILGMFIVNFNVVFGNYQDPSPMGRFLTLFSGNSSSVFVMLAGMGISLLTARPAYQPEERRRLQGTIARRAAFLFVSGLLLSLVWPADILHFYGVYLLVGAWLAFQPRWTHLAAAGVAVVVFHLLLVAFPYEKGWNIATLQYTDFWTLNGFLRNLFFNGWNPVFPWLAFFTTGMYLGRLDWNTPGLPLRLFLTGLALYAGVSGLQTLAAGWSLSEEMRLFLTADYLPPMLPFLLSMTGFGFMLISASMVIGRYLDRFAWAQALASTGRMTFTHYVAHLVLGIPLFAALTGHTLTELENRTVVVRPEVIAAFSVGYFAVSFAFSALWSRFYRQGPLEGLMRKVAG